MTDQTPAPRTIPADKVREILTNLALPEGHVTSLTHPIKSWALDAEGRRVVWTAPGATVMIQRIEPGDLTPAQARDLALNLLAAAAYSEGDHDD